MATTGTQLEVPHIVGAGAIVGQGNQPELWVLYSTTDAQDEPVWQDATSKVLSFSSSRGRGSELQEIEAGTGQVSLDDRLRTFDSVVNTAIEPMNRWWVRVQFSGVTRDIIKGYADSYEEDWPAPVGNAVTTVPVTDEMKVLALDRLPTTNPPRNTYSDLVQADNPAGYWNLGDDPAALVQAAIVPVADVVGDAQAAEQATPTVENLGFSLDDTWWKPGYPRR